MKILVANKFFWSKGGSERVLFDLIRGYESRGHEVVPFSMRDVRNVPTPWETSFVSNVDYATLRGPIARVGAALRAVHSFEAARKIEDLCRRTRPDVAHLHNIHHQLSPSIVGSLGALGIPVVFTLHDYKVICPNYLLFTEGAVCERCKGGRFYEAIRHRCLHGSIAASAAAAFESAVHRTLGTLKRRVRLFVAPSRFLGGKLVEHGFDAARVRFVPNGVDLAELAPAPTLGSKFVFAGRLAKEKGIANLLDAIARTARAELVVAGDGPLAEELRLRAGRDAPGRVTFVGTLERADVLRLVRDARALVLPSTWYENAPMSALEALGLGVPVIGSRIGGIPEMVREGESGLLVPPEDPAALAAAIDRLDADPELARRLGAGGREIVRREYSLDAQVETMIAMFREVASSESR